MTTTGEMETTPMLSTIRIIFTGFTPFLKKIYEHELLKSTNLIVGSVVSSSFLIVFASAILLTTTFTTTTVLVETAAASVVVA